MGLRAADHRSVNTEFRAVDGLLLRQARVTNNTAHSKRINRIVAWNRYDPHTVRHNNVLSLARDPEASFLQSFDCSKMGIP